MSELISGKEALIALANGEDVEFDAGIGTCHLAHKGLTLHCFDSYKFRLKPRTIIINGIEVPAPFKPKVGSEYWHIQTCRDGYSRSRFNNEYCDQHLVAYGAWRTEDEIKQVVEALRKVFNP